MTPESQININELLKDGIHFAEKRGDRIYIINSLTGDSYIMYADPRTSKIPTHFVESALPTGEKCWIQQGLAPVPAGGVREMSYNPTIIHLLCQRITEGGSITKICGTEHFPPYNTLRAWAKQHPWIDEHVDRARRDRAEVLRDRALSEAEEATSRDPIDAHSLRVDTYKWLAGVDHERYNPKTKIEATINTPTQIIIHTGINRDPIKDVTPGVTPEEIPQSTEEK